MDEHIVVFIMNMIIMFAKLHFHTLCVGVHVTIYNCSCNICHSSNVILHGRNHGNKVKPFAILMDAYLQFQSKRMKKTLREELENKEVKNKHGMDASVQFSE